MGYHVFKTENHPLLRPEDGQLRIGMTVVKGTVPLAVAWATFRSMPIFYTWLVVMFCLFVKALYERNVTATNSCVHLSVIG